MPLTQRELDAMPCSCCGGPPHAAEPMDLGAKCHPDGGRNIAYADGVLFVTCHECGVPVCRIAVAVSSAEVETS